jgi:hypothetical protein
MSGPLSPTRRKNFHPRRRRGLRGRDDAGFFAEVAALAVVVTSCAMSRSVSLSSPADATEDIGRIAEPAYRV